VLKPYEPPHESKDDEIVVMRNAAGSLLEPAKQSQYISNRLKVAKKITAWGKSSVTASSHLNPEVKWSTWSRPSSLNRRQLRSCRPWSTYSPLCAVDRPRYRAIPRTAGNRSGGRFMATVNDPDELANLANNSDFRES
jgi:hypothetical protein